MLVWNEYLCPMIDCKVHRNLRNNNTRLDSTPDANHLGHAIEIDPSEFNSLLGTEEGAKPAHLTDTVEQLHQLLLGHVIDHILQFVIIRGASAAHAIGWRRIVDRVVDPSAKILIFVGLCLLHPEEETSRRRFKFQQIDPTCLALIDAFEFTVIWGSRMRSFYVYY